MTIGNQPGACGLNRRIALKVLRPPAQPEAAEDFRRRFEAEAESLAKLAHPNIVNEVKYLNTNCQTQARGKHH